MMTLRAHIKLFQTYLIFFPCEYFCINFLTPHGGRHSACCVTSYGLHLSATPVLTAHMTSYGSPAGSQEFADWFTLQSLEASMIC